jgi:hypothetical protein
MMNCNGYGRNVSWLKGGIFLRQLRKSTNNINQDNGCPSRGSNWASPVCKSRELSVHSLFPFRNVFFLSRVHYTLCFTPSQLWNLLLVLLNRSAFLEHRETEETRKEYHIFSLRARFCMFYAVSRRKLTMRWSPCRHLGHQKYLSSNRPQHWIYEIIRPNTTTRFTVLRNGSRMLPHNFCIDSLSTDPDVLFS